MFHGKVMTALGGLLLIASAMGGTAQAADDIVSVGGQGKTCQDDPGCINRLHPDIPMAVMAKPGQTIRFCTRDATDVLGPGAVPREKPTSLKEHFGDVHPLAGPVGIEGARAGDVIAVTIVHIDPSSYGWTSATPFGFAADLVGGGRTVLWRLDPQRGATTDGIPGVRIPKAAFPGTITTLPGPKQLDKILAREKALMAAGGDVSPPLADLADPADLCGPKGRDKDRCLRTIPPREIGGNLDIRYLGEGATLYLPCHVDGCGLAIGDVHFAQGDGEIAGTAIEMSADVWVKVAIVKNPPDLSRGPNFEGPARLLNIPSRRFYAVTGFAFKKAGKVPPEMAYLDSPKLPGLTSLNKNVVLAARNAVGALVDYIVARYGYDRGQAYIIASVAADLRLPQVVNAPNYEVTAILPLDIFEAGKTPK